MRILYLADIRLPLERANGIQTVETCHALARRGHDVTLLSRPDTQVPPRDVSEFYGLPPLDRLRFEPVGMAGPSAMRRAVYLFSAAVRASRKRYDAVFTRDLGVASLLVRHVLARRPPLVYESHGFAPGVRAERHQLLSGSRRAPAWKLRRLWKQEERVWRRAEGYITITRSLLTELAARFGPRERAEVIPDGARPCDTMSPPSDTAFIVGYAGHLYPWKGVDTIVEAVALAPAVRALVIGGHTAEPDLARLEALASTRGVSDRIEFTGPLPPASVSRRLAAAHVLVLPNRLTRISAGYTSPLKMFEYLALGRPIVASNLVALREVLTADTTVFVPPDDPRAMAEAFDSLARDPGRRAALGAAAASLAGEYTWDRRAARIGALLSRVTNRPGRRTSDPA